ncbi:beta-1,3-galactosyl-O-glycosyl-glycoprotein beta-1,6-N-acetylglucosaminyltransferase-like [Ruditapes philippinarum]|uniref:beta-1,3-galactosyl-O-glycosyl-glycoprotein beta-1,6-N-acetylglucosaminyltransferase-like n=1 Tax=Ruditapes philippinarum TaxID=129788 RepID=UPI00295BE582|nr:beta-1,3-galactosyl-O-glycosyl-glycoprotein beta-1,6-N-acetylglucosaminyltransferase-like [Ruditapes philippinarum]
MNRCKIVNGIHKGVLICLVLLLYFLSYISIAPDKRLPVVLNNTERTRSYNKRINIQTSTYATNLKTSISVSTSAISYSSKSRTIIEDDRMINEKEHMKNEDHMENKKNHFINNEDNVPNEEDNVIKEDDRMGNYDNHVINKENRLPNKENHVISEDDHFENEEEHVIYEDDPMKNEENHVINKKNHVANEENRVINGNKYMENVDNHVINEDDHMKSEENHVINKENHLPNHENHVISGDDYMENEDRVINEDNYMKNEEKHVINKENRLQNEKDHAINEKDQIENEKDRMVNEKDNPLYQDSRMVNAEDNKINENKNSKMKEDKMLNKNVYALNEEERIINERYFGENTNRKIIGCKELFKREMSGANRVRKIVTQGLPSWTPQKYEEKTKNCSSFIDERGYITHPLTTEEQQFPIAFSILMYKNVEQVERLLRAIYRPQNIYCIHVDSKTNIEIYGALSGISQCFENVFVLRKRINVIWGKMSVLTPELLCMEELWKRHKTWKYFINLTGQEFPLKTNYELVKILQAYNGANDVEATVKQNLGRCRGISRTRPPHGIRVTKGAVHVAVTRGYVDYVLHDRRARDILKWMSYSCYIPDEAFFTTLNHNPHLHVPGSYKGYPETSPMSNTKKPYLARFKNRLNSRIHRWPCHGKWVRSMCIFNFKDLHTLSTRKELFANKFHLYDNPLPYACMEELIFNRTRDEFQGTRTFNASWYSTLGFVKRHV